MSDTLDHKLKHFNAHHLHQTASLLVRRIMHNAQWEEIEKHAGDKIISLVKDSLLSLSSDRISDELDVTLSPKTFNQLPDVLLSESFDFEAWIQAQVKAAVHAAAPHIDNLAIFAEEVIETALEKTKEHIHDAVSYFLFYDSELTTESKRILKEITQKFDSSALE